mmetsp:Transcript_9910/g.33613  ORF Transcript_9910/g.33613 Transcript_9910/m.33613 type:complete len:207 (+) Transcript_9910:242-862(+)
MWQMWSRAGSECRAQQRAQQWAHYPSNGVPDPTKCPAGDHRRGGLQRPAGEPRPVARALRGGHPRAGHLQRAHPRGHRRPVLHHRGARGVEHRGRAWNPGHREDRALLRGGALPCVPHDGGEPDQEGQRPGGVLLQGAAPRGSQGSHPGAHRQQASLPRDLVHPHGHGAPLPADPGSVRLGARRERLPRGQSGEGHRPGRRTGAHV